MQQLYGFVLELKDMFSKPLKTINQNLSQLNKTQTAAQKISKDYGTYAREAASNIGELRLAISHLKEQRDLIPRTQLESIRAANIEIRKFENEVVKLEKLNGGAIANLKKTAFELVPTLALATNPIVAIGTAIGAAGKFSMDFNQGLAKVNATAQLSADQLSILDKDLRAIGISAGVELSKVPAAMEVLVSITNDVALSQQSLKTALEVSKAGFVDSNEAAATLARTMGSLNTNDFERVADVLFASQREGAVEFKELANELPRLLPTARELSYEFEEVAGIFSFMTKKGLSAADSGTLLQNIFTALGKPEIREGLEGIGVNLKDGEGNIISLVDTVKVLQQQLGSMSLDDKLKALKDIGLNDAQARQGLMTLLGDYKLLEETVSNVKNAKGSLNDALNNSRNTWASFTEVLSVIQGLMLNIGDYVLPILNVGFKGLALGLSQVYDHFDLTIGGLIALTGFLKGAAIQTQLLSFWSKIAASGAWLQSVANLGLAGSFRAVTAAIYNIPIVGWLLAAIGLVITLWSEWDAFRYSLIGVWEVLKNIDRIFVKIMTLDFSGAARVIKEAFNVGFEGAKAKDKKKKLDDPLNPSDVNPFSSVGGGSLNAQVASVSDSVASGGTKRVSITIENLRILENTKIEVAQLQEGIDDLENRVAEAVLRGLNGAVLAVGS